jgi:nuclear pore complex protein Nup107
MWGTLNFSRRPGASDPFHVTQLRVILDQADSLLLDFGNYLGSSELPHSASELVHAIYLFIY